ncbi:MAG: DNA cytosine methyltransferase, partial [Desulfurellales bacterium]
MYLNEIEPFAADWLASEYPDATIDRRSIADVAPADIAGFRRVHFFAGLGGWEIALRLAGWPDDREVWTGSCPCQPFSAAGKRQGTADERHLWPEMFRLIRERRPATVFGEQVASSDGLAWLDGVFADLEGAGYACGAADLCAAGVGAPHIRQRLYWVANASRSAGERRAGGFSATKAGVCGENWAQHGHRAERLADGGEGDRLANADGQDTGSGQQRLRAGDRRGGGNEGEQERAADRLAHTSGP